MTPRHKKRLQQSLFLFITLVAMVFAWLHGRSVGIRKGLQDSFYMNKLHAGQELSALKSLHAGKYERVRDSLETGLNLSVVMLTAKDGAEYMEEKTRKDMLEILRQIKEYRQTTPWLGGDEGLRPKIEEALSSIESD